MSQNAAKANNIFASELFQVMFERGSSENIFFSPMSISAALAMTTLGARDATYSQMKDVLKLNTIKEGNPHQSFADLNRLVFSPDAPYILKAANKLFSQKDYPLLPSFLDETTKYYGASVDLLDFINDGEASRRSINLWVEEQTDNHINDLLPEGALNEMTRLVLVNAIYFKGNWASQFRPADTIKGKFFISESENIEVPMMHAEGSFSVAVDEAASCAILELPYVKKEVSLFVVLPDKIIGGLADIQTFLSRDKIEEWVTKVRNGSPPKVRVSIPKFTLEQKFLLKDVLMKMGMSDAFDNSKADFSGMTAGKDLFVSSVIHKAFLEVNEEGSEAAAATAVTLMLRCASMRPREFKVNRPFMMFIRENKSGAVLFIGQLCNPAS